MGGRRHNNHRYHDIFVPRSPKTRKSNWNNTNHDPSYSIGARIGEHEVTPRRRSLSRNEKLFQQHKHPLDEGNRSHRDKIARFDNTGRRPAFTTTRNIDSCTLLLRQCLRLNENLLLTIDETFQQLMTLIPNLTLDERDVDKMEWKSEPMIVIPQFQDVRYCWDRRIGDGIDHSGDRVEADVEFHGTDGLAVDTGQADAKRRGGVKIGKFDRWRGQNMNTGVNLDDYEDDTLNDDVFVPVPRCSRERMQGVATLVDGT